MRLIDADKLESGEVIIPTENGGYEYVEVFYKDDVDNAPPVDAIEVIRCKDCRWGREVCGNIECSTDLNLPPEYHGYEWFCPNGERGEEETN